MTGIPVASPRMPSSLPDTRTLGSRPAACAFPDAILTARPAVPGGDRRLRGGRDAARARATCVRVGGSRGGADASGTSGHTAPLDVAEVVYVATPVAARLPLMAGCARSVRDGTGPVRPVRDAEVVDRLIADAYAFATRLEEHP